MSRLCCAFPLAVPCEMRLGNCGKVWRPAIPLPRQCLLPGVSSRPCNCVVHWGEASLPSGNWRPHIKTGQRVAVTVIRHQQPLPALSTFTHNRKVYLLEVGECLSGEGTYCVDLTSDPERPQRAVYGGMHLYPQNWEGKIDSWDLPTSHSS